MLGEGKLNFTANDKVNYELVFNETIILLTRIGTIEVILPKEGNNWRFKVVFEENDKLAERTHRSEYDNGLNTFFLNKWFDDYWIENILPISIKSTDGRLEILIKIRSIGNNNQDHRSTSISVWKKTENKL